MGTLFHSVHSPVLSAQGARCHDNPFTGPARPDVSGAQEVQQTRRKGEWVDEWMGRLQET